MELGVTPDGLTLHVDDEVLVCDRDARDAARAPSAATS